MANIIKYCNRPFKNVVEMDECMIQRWNERVKDGDTVYHLGDISMGNPYLYLKRLRGIKHVIVGNHDRPMSLRSLASMGDLASISDLLEVKDRGRDIVLCHYAMRVWNKSHHGSLHFYGHSHGSLPGNEQSLDIGVDCWDFHPVTLDEAEARLGGSS